MGRTIITGVNVLNGIDPGRAECTIVVENDRIVSVGPDAGDVMAGPEDTVVDGHGLTAIPGMTQGHFHSTYHNISRFSLPHGFEAPPAYQAYIAAHNVGLALKSGFTSVVGATEPWDINPSLKRMIAEGLVTGPRIICGSRELITTADSTDMIPWYWEASSWGGMRIVDGPDEYRKAVRTEIKRGAEIVKMFATGGHATLLSEAISSVTGAEIQAGVKAAHNLGRRVRAHVASRVGVLKCLDAGVDIIDHGDGIDDECIERMAAQGVSYVPSVFSHKRLSEMNDEPDFVGRWGDVVRETCAALPKCVAAGVNIVVGDDYGGQTLPHGTYGTELQFWHEFTGLSKLEILKWATANGGKLVGLPDLGRLLPGWIADIVLVNGDPSLDLTVVADVQNIMLVMRDGQIQIDNLHTGSNAAGASARVHVLAST